MNAAVILDIVISLLLIVTVYYCWKLSRRITLLHDGKEDLNSFIKDFNSAIIRAEKNIDELKHAGLETDKKLQEQIQKARFLANDLSFLMNKGENVADNLEKQIGASRTITSRPPILQQKPPKQITPPPQTKIQTSAPETKIVDSTQPTTENSKPSESKKMALDDVLSQIANRKKMALEQKSKPEERKQDETAKVSDEIKKRLQSNPFDKRRLSETLSATKKD